jgi:drug/metabolite transporter (DMT)-like permease
LSRGLLVALLLSLPALADPPARLLPKEAPPAAVDFGVDHTWMAVGLVSGAVVTALLTVLAIVLTSSHSFARQIDATCSAATPCP